MIFLLQEINKRLQNCFFTLAYLKQTGSELKTKSLPVRIAIGFWWLFALVVVSSYTANLAAFLTVQRMDLPIRSLNDLVKQKAIGYGTVAQTSFYDNILVSTDAGYLLKRMV